LSIVFIRALAKVEGICAGVSSGGAISAALRLSAEVENAVIAVIVCDRGDRYLSTGDNKNKALTNCKISLIMREG
jgi:cysteine synthase B